MILQASVQYDDWVGQAAADNADNKDIAALLRERNLITDEDFVIGVKLWVGENHDGKVQRASVHALVVQGKDMDQIEGKLRAQSDPIHLREIDLSMSVSSSWACLSA